MIGRIGDNIISSLGFTTGENFSAVKAGISGVKHHEAGVFDLPEAFMASLLDRKRLGDEFAEVAAPDGYTDVEKAVILSVFGANKEAQIDLSGEKTLFILSTTKGNIDKMNCAQQITKENKHGKQYDCSLYLWHTAERIAGFFKNPHVPVVVSNACISGAAAQIVAMRALQSGRYDYAVVAGVDLLSKFIVSGFQSFKALSPQLCRPFDKDRCGLNLGEGAATIIYGKSDKAAFRLLHGAIRNDATHISAPSRTGEGSYNALKAILQEINPGEVAFVNGHGTATPYNDAMEANALVRAGLEQVPVDSLKAFFGHTLGAAGVLETIISAKAFVENRVLKSMNFEEQDFEKRINIAREDHVSDKKYFIKLLAGFGGCNAALLFTRGVRK